MNIPKGNQKSTMWMGIWATAASFATCDSVDRLYRNWNLTDDGGVYSERFPRTWK